ncbi:50S ribosomal protein L7/L12 [Pseudomonas lalucatii]|uniref:50S ribosomal protein L7/L12 n=1 Tax=Pseudomonas lalucatii TaxID=1424203 RepID=A0ABS5Q5Y9_9PSED|nr:50S ribosomal protein L7/L12 [Pseudomonas lalucatii]MBS7663539.1 50S ribosomal protein L7/L12 [Pseudomonas lalucatii]MBS7689791.1 50S ribosomal protein L7/L12 [Pseudomonas lalucatii]MBS7725076.1 50S ribosomal protein L7/L12 [Pseudomonas lalucatii]QVM86957.1 50S ribosomal protein L7/L12 [Pseudomonas lalucatii]
MIRQRDDLPPQVQAALRQGRKIEAIKRLREERGLGLQQAKQDVDAYLRAHPELHGAGRPARHRHGLTFWLLLSLLLGVVLLLFSRRL